MNKRKLCVNELNRCGVMPNRVLVSNLSAIMPNLVTAPNLVTVPNVCAVEERPFRAASLASH